MKLLGVSLQIHKWVALIVGVQVLFWTLGGVVMTAIPIERVRGEHHQAKAAPKALDLSAMLPAAEAARRAGVARPSGLVLKSTPRGPAWIVTAAGGGDRAVDARTGLPLPKLDGPRAASLAALAYVGSGKPVAARYYAAAPKETGKEGPLWRVDFDDAERTSFYLAPETGEVVSRRSNVWRFYDFFWRLHILNFGSGENFNHPLLIAAAGLTLPMILAGFVLLWIRLARDFRMTQAKRRKPA